jgi:hypothetical protein
VATWKEIATKEFVSAGDASLNTAMDALSLNVDSDTGITTNTVLGSEELVINGVTNQIITTGAADSISIGFPDQVSIDTSLTVPTINTATLNNTAGGVGIIFTGASNEFKILKTGEPTNTELFSLDAAGDVNLTGQLFTDSHINLGGSGRLLNVNRLSFGALGNAGSAQGVLDEDNMVTDSDSHLATQQSIKAYADSVSQVAKYYYETKVLNFASTDSTIYLPMSGTEETTSLVGQNDINGFIPAYTGSVEKILLRSSNTHTGYFRFSIYEADNGDTIPDSEVGRYDSASSTYTADNIVEFDLTGTLPLGNNNIRNDRMYAFRLITPDQPGDMNVTLVLRWNLG